MKLKKLFIYLFSNDWLLLSLNFIYIYQPSSKRVCLAFKFKQEITSFKHISKPCSPTIIKAFCFAPVTNKPNDLYSFTNHKWYFKNNNLSKIFWKVQNNEFYNLFFFKMNTNGSLFDFFNTKKLHIPIQHDDGCRAWLIMYGKFRDYLIFAIAFKSKIIGFAEIISLSFFKKLFKLQKWLTHIKKT